MVFVSLSIAQTHVLKVSQVSAHYAGQRRMLVSLSALTGHHVVIEASQQMMTQGQGEIESTFQCIMKQQTVNQAVVIFDPTYGMAAACGSWAAAPDAGALTALRSVSKLRRMSPMGFNSSATMLSSRCEFMLHRSSRCDILKTICFH